MAEISGRFVDAEASRSPAINTYKIIYTASAGDAGTGPLGLDVCNGEATDAWIDIAIVPASEAGYVDGNTPPTYSFVHKKQKIESDASDGNTWIMPVKHINGGDRVVVRTTLAGVTFYPHGIRGS